MVETPYAINYFYMKYVYFIIIIFILCACSISKASHTSVFSKLNKNVQDTLISVSQKVLEEDYSPQSMIDFSGHCKLIEKHFGPWIVEIQIKDTINKTNITLPSNAPAPYIVYNNLVYYPHEYNLFVMGFESNTKFNVLKMK